MSEHTQESITALNHMIAICDELGCRDMAKVVVDSRTLKLVVEMARIAASAKRQIADEKAADYDAIVRLLHRGFKGG